MEYICNILSCDRPVYARRLCSLHYQRNRRTGDPERIIVKTCSIEGCSRKYRSKGLCDAHYQKLRKYGDANHNSGNGDETRRIVFDGYVFLFRPDHPNSMSNGRIAEHRLVMSEKLGRPLFPGENVHHKNGNKKDNSPDNLELWVVGQPAGQRPEDLVKWAKEILERYNAD